MGKLTESKKIVSALRNLEKTIFLVKFCGTVCTHLPKPRDIQFFRRPAENLKIDL